MREILLGRVRSRLERFGDGRAPAALLDPQVVVEVRGLLEGVPAVAADPEVALVAACVYWARGLIGGPGESRQDLGAALALFALVDKAQPETVLTVAAGPSLEGGQGWPCVPEVASERAVAVLGEMVRGGDRVMLDGVIGLLRGVLRGCPVGRRDRVSVASNLSAALQRRFHLAGRYEDLDAAIAASRIAVKATAPGDSSYGGALSNLGNALRVRFTLTGERADLDAAIIAGRSAVAVTPPGGPTRVAVLSNLGSALRDRFDLSGERADLDSAITADQEAVDSAAPDHPDRVTVLSNLLRAVNVRFDRYGDWADLDLTITASRALVEATGPGYPNYPLYLAYLGVVFNERYHHSRALKDVDDAVEAVRAAVVATPPDDAARAVRLSGLSDVYRQRFERTGDLTDLDLAVQSSQSAVDVTPAGDLERAARLSDLGDVSRLRFERTGDLTDLQDAIRACHEAVEATPSDHPNRAWRLSHLGNALRTRYERLDDPADLNASIEAGRAAVNSTAAGHPNRAGYLINLTLALRIRFRRSGVPADGEAAIATAQAAVDASPPGSPLRAMCLSTLGSAFQARFERVGDVADLNAAVTAAQDATEATVSDGPDHAALLLNLGIAHSVRFERLGERADLDSMIDAYRAASAVPGAAPRIRAAGARAWGRAAAGDRRWREAVEGFATAADLLGQVVPRSLNRGDQEHQLAELGSLGADAAACCMHVGLVDRAVELFELGRGVLLGQALDSRTDLTLLAEKHPTIAASFTGLLHVLDRTSTDSGPVPSVRTPIGAQDEAATRRAASLALEDLIAEIRRLDGFEGFLRPPRVADLLATATDGPVVLVAVSDFGSYALLLADGRVQAVPLQGLTPQAVYERVVAFAAALDNAAAPAAAQRQLGEILRWLWDVLAGPVLERLGITGSPGVGDLWPRLWWCTSGLLSFLPVHAAGDHDTRFDPAPATVLDRVISSYTPTVRALDYARHRGAATTGSPLVLHTDDRLLAVAMPRTPGAGDLPGAHDEVAALQARFHEQVLVLAGVGATRQSVLTTLPAVRWAHFACHGAANLTDPSAGGLLLADQALTVLDVAQLRMEQADFAYLSACSTAMPGARLADEAIHLASAFQLAGYRHVIATLWPIGDRHAVTIAADIYNALAASGDAAAAVHIATRTLRRRWAAFPSVWASHIHVGA